jgi:ubiquinone/menaquinone biosynthesis C-methylase UbiE
MPHLPFADRSFDKAYSINSYQFWPHKTRALAELGRVVRPGGLVVVAVQPRSKGATNDTSTQAGAELVRGMTAAGFGSVKLLVKPMTPVATACVVATV